MKTTLDTAARTQIIEALAALLNANYIFPDVAQRMVAHLRQRLADGNYDALVSLPEFADTLTGDLRATSQDKHLRVWYDPQQAAALAKVDPLTIRFQPDEGYILRLRRDNFGFRKLERLTGNIGYLDLRMFAEPELAGETAVAAMNFLAYSRALIFDLRQNGGGSPNMVQLLTSYLFDPEIRHLNSFYIRPMDKHIQFWTLPYVPGKRMPDVPVYVLTSRNTFSGAEEFAYNLRQMERVTLVGETTGGGANPGAPFPVLEGLVAFIAGGRAINPITQTNWEGTGVEPHIPVPADQALHTAHVEALQRLIAHSSDDQDRRELRWDLETVHALNKPAPVDEAQAQRFVGNYQDRKILLENGALVYQDSGGTKHTVVPLPAGGFCMNDDLRLYLSEQALIIRRRDSTETVFPRTS